MRTQRRSGVLLHPTSLPGPFGIGDMGQSAIEMLDWLDEAGQSIWQILPLGPTGLGNAPYNASSAFAGNPLLISPALLVEDGFLPSSALEGRPDFPADRVDYGAVLEWKEPLLRRAWTDLGGTRSLQGQSALGDFAADPAQRPWLEDWALFAALKHRFEGESWQHWPRELRLRDPQALERARSEMADEIGYQTFLQLIFSRQWSALRAAAGERGVLLLGDLPIYVGLDSADVWAHQELFDLDEDGRPRHVAGVPPDAFSDTGQLWGNPLYDWQRLAETGYGWWIDRMRATLAATDAVRVDHFRGFAGYWKVRVEDETAENGVWVEGPGRALFEALEAALGKLPLLAEDLGVITDDVHELRRHLGLPSMRVLQFGFGDPVSDHLPHNLERSTAFYTGTHDNDTITGWFESLDAELRPEVLAYSGSDGSEIHWQMIRLAMTSVAETVVVPLQDVLGLGSEARMNMPGEAAGNWEWRARAHPGAREAARLRALTELTGRLPA